MIKKIENSRLIHWLRIIWLGSVLLYVTIFSTPAQAADPIQIDLSGQRISEAALASADFNGDGKKEIVVGGKDGKLYVIDGATYSVMWEQQLADYFDAAITPTYCGAVLDVSGVTSTDIRAGISVGDLNNDGKLEIVVATGGHAWLRKVGAVIVLTYTGNSSKFSLMAGWPRLACDEIGDPNNFSNPDGIPDGFLSTPAVGDLDGDGDLEIVIGGLDRRLHAWHHNGSQMAGWPIDRLKNYWRDSSSSPALADIDRDGLLEVIVGSNDYLIPGCPNPYEFYVINGDGSFVPGFPVQTSQNIASSPAIGDLDEDGWLDIVVGTGFFNESCGQPVNGHKVYAWDHTGQPLPGWPQSTAGNMPGSPALGDLDGDGDLEVVIGCSDHLNHSCTLLYAWHGDGRPVAGFPMNPTNKPMHYSHSPILADYDGDGEVEIMLIDVSDPIFRFPPCNWNETCLTASLNIWGAPVIVQSATNITIVEHDGTLDPNQQNRTSAAFLDITPVVDDIDGDGLLETIIGGANSTGNAAIYIWDERGSSYVQQPWPMFHRDISRTGFYPLRPKLGFASELRFLHDQDDGPTASQTQPLQNLHSGAFDWQITHFISNLQVSPSSGTVSSEVMIQFTVTTTGYVTNTWHYLGDLNISGTAYGQPVISSPQTIPVWLYTGDLKQLNLPIILKQPPPNTSLPPAGQPYQPRPRK